jgi:hypothetical protein
MTTLRILIALSVAALASACASTGAVTATPPSPAPTDEHASHELEASATAPVTAMDPRMKVMHEMHQKMMNAKTPEERQALMADHMKAMQGGMAMMNDMSGMGATGAKPAMAGMGAMGGGKDMPTDMAMHHRMMAQRMDMMQMMIEMMMDRMPPTPAK